MAKTKEITYESKKNKSLSVFDNYPAWLESLKKQIIVARARAALSINAELIHLYHKLGLDILKQQQAHNWGDKIIQHLAADLKAAFPDMKGFSERNLKYMRFYAEQCPTGLIGQQPAAQLPWFHIVTILTKTKSMEREWYAIHAIAAIKLLLNMPCAMSIAP